MIELMIDLETLDTKPTAVVLSIGVQAFEGKELKEGLLLRPSVVEQIGAKRTISLKTIRFWTGCTIEAIEEAMVDEPERLSVHTCYMHLRDWIRHHMQLDYRTTPIWANGDLFDLGLLEDLWHIEGSQTLWYYNAPRDLRSVMTEATRFGWMRPESLIAHTALGDCTAQIAMLNSVRDFYEDLAHRAVHGHGLVIDRLCGPEGRV